MKIETKHHVINASAEKLFAFLTDMNNYQQLFPEEKIENWESDTEKCAFRIKGMTDIGLKKVASTPNSLIYMDSFGKVPFKFTLNIYLSEQAENKTLAYSVFDGEINPFMKMMVEKPLTNFFNMLVEKVATIHQ